MSKNAQKLILKFGGIMLIILGILHLAVTPFIVQFINSNTTKEGAQWLTPPMLLNHVVVGILLLPLGALTFYAATAAANGERWALVVTRITSATIATLPITLVVLMDKQYFEATPFLAATIILCIACITLLATAFLPAKKTQS